MTPLKIHMVEIQSTVLIDALKDIMKIEGVHLSSPQVAKFMKPFKLLFFSYDKIMALVERNQEEVLLQNHLELLGQVMEEIFEADLEMLDDLKASGFISYELA